MLQILTKVKSLSNQEVLGCFNISLNMKQLPIFKDSKSTDKNTLIITQNPVNILSYWIHLR